MLAITIGVLSYQTAALAGMSRQLEDAQIGVGGSPATVSFTDDGSSPAMVGGC